MTSAGGLTEKGREELEKRVPKAVFLVRPSLSRKTLRKAAGKAPSPSSVCSTNSTIATDSPRDSFSGASRASSPKFLKSKRQSRWLSHFLATQVPSTTIRNGGGLPDKRRNIREGESEGAPRAHQSLAGSQHSSPADLPRSPGAAEKQLEQRNVKQGADIGGAVLHKGPKDNNGGECGQSI